MATPLNILVVEDSAEDTDLMVRELRRGGYDVAFERVETEEALAAALSHNSWDVVLSDHSLPRFSAPHALAVLRASGRDVPFIIVSGAIGEETAVAIMKAGASDYLHKDNLNRLVAVIQREMRDAEERRARRRLEREILEVSEREQRRIARDLHEGLGQSLAGVSFMIKDIEQRLAAHSPSEADDMHKLGDLINEAVEYTRSIAKGLSPVELVADGLMIALGELGDSVRRVYNVPCRFDCAEPILIADNVVATNLYYIAREAALNAAKHGKPGSITIRFERAGEAVVLSVCDDGAGFSPDAAGRKGLGLHIMKYRAHLIGAHLDIRRNAGRGISVVCSLPRTTEAVTPPPRLAS